MTRRTWLSALGASLLPSGTAWFSAFAQSNPARIAITGYETFVVRVNARGNWRHERGLRAERT
ncbi:MAG: hypothetical protein ABSB35_24945 [Bryobacteraceae bacterium]|jgi:hypothetical protein